MRRLGLLLTSAGLGLAGPAGAAPTDPEGRLALRGLWSRDDGGGPTVGLAFLDTDARAGGLTRSGLALRLDAGFVLDATEAQERRFGETESLDQVRELYAEQPGLAGAIDLRVGRRLIPEAGNGWVDGLEGRVALTDGLSLGLYGGWAPDPVDYALRADHQALGGYLSVASGRLDLDLAYHVELADTALDRHFAFLRGHARATDELFLATYAIVDMVGGPNITTLLATTDYTPIQALTLTLNLSRYSVARYRDQTVYRNVLEPNQALLLGDEVAELVYNRAQLSASVHAGGGLYHYQVIEHKRRSQDGGRAWLYTIGARHDDAFGAGLRVDGHATLDDDFASDAWWTAVEVERDLGADWTLAARATWFDGRTVGRTTERGRTFDEAQSILLCGASALVRLDARHHVDVDYDLVFESELQDARNQDDLAIHTLMGRYVLLL